jgi:tetratricopeptide (TPR) repeat protein
MTKKTSHHARPSSGANDTLQNLLVIVPVLLITALLYYQTVDHEYISYDDYQYVKENPHVHKGITLESFVWAFQTTSRANWHPVTWLSYMLDIHLFGLNPGSQHLMNLLWHLLNTILVFWICHLMTGARYRSAFVAAVFALHPLHVESVAWIAERKDVLSIFWGLLSILFYIQYVKKQQRHLYYLVLLTFVIGLLAKPMLVTLPFVLLLLDYWPLMRYDGQYGQNGTQLLPALKKYSIEKSSLFLFSFVSCIITFIVQDKGRAVASTQAIPMYMRFLNALSSYARYVWDMVWPFDLAIFYPYPTAISVAKIILSGLLICGCSYLALARAKKYPWLLTGWFWFFGTLVPVIGLVQVGQQARADRYMYFPMIGIAIVMAWGVFALMNSKKKSALLLGLCAGIYLILIAVNTFVQIGFWRDNYHVFRRALDVTRNNVVAHFHLGEAYAADGKRNKAIAQYHKGLAIDPHYLKIHLNLGIALAETGDASAALRHYDKVLAAIPDDAQALNNYGLALLLTWDLPKAVSYFQEAVKYAPQKAEYRAHLHLANALLRQIEMSAAGFQKQLDHPKLFENGIKQLISVHDGKKRLIEAIHGYRKAVSRLKGFRESAFKESDIPALHGAMQAYEAAVPFFLKVCRKTKGNALANYHLACISTRRHQPERALQHMESALSAGFCDTALFLNDFDLFPLRPLDAFHEIKQRYCP